jgi:hypothetical protein
VWIVADNQIRIRAKSIFPTVLLTLLSIVQALALELLWLHLIDEPALYALSLIAVLSWLQIVATLLGILLIWLIYSDLVLRLSWLPNTADALFPFFVGILQFAQISALGPDHIGIWFGILGILFAAMAWISQITMKRARQDEDNEEFFRDIDPATWRDHLTSAVPAALLMLLGLAIWSSNDQGWFAMLALAGAVGLLILQIWRTHGYVQRSYALR